MKQNFCEWLSNRDKKLVDEIENEGFSDWVRKNPSISKALSMGVLGGALGHGVEAIPGMSHGHEMGHHAPSGSHGAPPDDHAPAPLSHGPETPHGPPPGHGGPPENHREKAETELLFHYIGETTRKQIEAIARKWKKIPSDPNFKRWLLRMFKRISGIRSSLSVSNLKDLPSTIGKFFVDTVDREMKHVQHIFSELPETEPDYDTTVAMNLIKSGDRFSTGRIDPDNQTSDGIPLPINRSAYRHRKQDRSGF